VPRFTLLLAKFLVSAAWSAGLAFEIIVVSLLMGAFNQFPGGSSQVILGGSKVLAVTAVMTIAVTLPFAFFASAGRGYLLPIGMAVFTLMLTNLVAVAGWGAYFPWAIPGLYSQADSQMLVPASGWIVLFTLVAGIFATYAWWKLADQNR
jgi:ABC-2 type transport system permease protein